MTTLTIQSSKLFKKIRLSFYNISKKRYFNTRLEEIKSETSSIPSIESLSINNINSAKYGYWKSSVKNRRDIFDQIATKLDLKQWEDWYQVSILDILHHGGSQVLQHYDNSLVRTLVNIYPERSWKLYRFLHSRRTSYWLEVKNQRRFLDDIKSKLKINQWEDWYQITSSDIELHGGIGLISKYPNGIPDAIPNIYPEFPFKKWKFKNIPYSLLKDLQLQRNLFDDIAIRLNIMKWTDWYSITRRTLINHGASGVIEKYSNSMFHTFKNVYPEYEWRQWGFNAVHRGYWTITNQRFFFDDLALKLNYEYWEDWYNLKSKDVEEHGGSGFMNFQYQGSPIRALTTVYPEHDWKIWRFATKPNHFFEDKSNVIEIIDYLRKKFDIRELDDWYQITNQQLSSEGLDTLINRYGGMIPLLTSVYPDHKWDLNLRNYGGKTQQLMFKFVRELLIENTDQYFNYVHPNLIIDLKFKNTDKPMNFDIFIPSLKLAFEYQGQQHYHSHFMAGKKPAKTRDEEKRQACEDTGITLLEIPYWWDNTIDSLANYIHKNRKDLLNEYTLIKGRDIPDKSPFKDPNSGPFADKPMSDNNDKLLSTITFKYPHKPILEEMKDLEIINFQKKEYSNRIWKEIDSHEELKEKLNNFIVPYYLSVGTILGGSPRCRGCKKKLSERSEFRIQVSGNFTTTEGSKYIGRVSFCMNVECIEKGAVLDVSKRKSFNNIEYPQFNGKVRLSDDVLEMISIKHPLPHIEGIEWSV